MDYLKHGPLGFPVVDCTVNLSTGQFHAVDSSDMAFKTCARQAMQEAMPKCEPVLLERSTTSRSRCRTPSPRRCSG